MPTHVSMQPEAIVDPRGEFRRKPVSLAARPTSVKGRTVLLFDNTQLTTQLDAYGPIFRWLSAYLEGEHGAACAYRSLNLLKEPRETLPRLADEISRGGVDYVIIALCNAGITQPTSLFAA